MPCPCAFAPLDWIATRKEHQLSAIVAEGLAKYFNPDIKAVDGLALDVPEGQIFGFLGANGSGKTTTVRMLTTLLRPTARRAEVSGLDLPPPPRPPPRDPRPRRPAPAHRRPGGRRGRAAEDVLGRHAAPARSRGRTCP